MLHSRPSHDFRVLAFGRRDETFSLVAQSVALTPHKGESHCDERRGTDAEAGTAAKHGARAAGPGFNIELKSIPLDGRIVLLPPDDSSDAADNSNANTDRDDRGGNGNGHRRNR